MATARKRSCALDERRCRYVRGQHRGGCGRSSSGFGEGAMQRGFDDVALALKKEAEQRTRAGAA
ncbi:MAG: hypothetical protein IPN77_16910 [Sandaracinaceae bacterium]|nr:hypothetical protein [Sandaracinaceae bacterium]